uniref:SET domain-containing protein n=1 Tax=Arion vulgaris TaxID=1028688 RepID=A0A0B6ZEH7_9EUPU
MITSTTIDVSHGAETYPVTYDDNSSTGASLQNSFKYVKTNVPGPGFDKDTFSEQFVGCDCSKVCTTNSCSCLQLFGGSVYDGNGRLKVDILRDLSSKPVLECGRECSCDPVHCTNRIVQQGIKKTLCIFHTKDKGYGLMLDNNKNSEISSLSFVCEYAGEVIGDAEARKRLKQTDITAESNYLIALREHVSGTEACIYIDPRYLGNVGRFINHSCDPNLFMVPVRANHLVPRLALFARKNIKPGEELTFDYSGNSTLNVSDFIAIVEPINSQIGPLNSETSNSSDISLHSTLMHMTQNSQSSESYFNPPKKRTKFQNEGHCSVENSNLEDHQKDELTVKLNQSVKRKPCFCGSYNCSGLLPLDSTLLCD